MIHYQKKIFVILAILLPLLDFRCLYGTKIDKQIIEKYKYIPGSYENISILKELNQKAKNYCSQGFYMEIHYTDKYDSNYDYIEKIYFQDGNSRKELYDVNKNKFKKVSIYDKKEDMFYEYNADKDELQSIENFTEKHNGVYPYKNGYFQEDNNVSLGNMEYVNYKGKKILQSETIINLTGKRFESKYWYDNETGIILKAEEKHIQDNKVLVYKCIDYTMRSNVKFDKELFKFDEKRDIRM
ncbi:hypothetical protein [Clostridium sp. ZS2-4]|uniref:hypothetical protein n=1 Tax=Clostridium sp. ZS2-4 TaxID=2987703 RepID=UPI00227AD7C9|nr:hypothetical protein [Clostridium sp. ZS2-4]MCY6353694.1 hypothetical protein [Clostridium sp. ZS2-4]